MPNNFANESEFAILKILEHDEFYGMQIVKAGKIARGTVYVTLSRMLAEGWINIARTLEGHPGIPRPVYRITRLGCAMLDALRVASSVRLRAQESRRGKR
jgi:DNA-binding PadR family transcriptional regulator